ncbi:MAG: YdeI/OmpD-associated family protein [Gemmatimonadota bacterium]|nr:YdeI/OmpD-associated family protein [Gemmatimonadota bacterium]
MTPTFFVDAEVFRKWLAENASSKAELLVGFRKVGSGLSSMSWSESVDEALCFGWIDGVRKRIDDESYSIRFTPRKPTSIWSAVNMAKVEALRAMGRMTPAGEQAFLHRKEHKSVVYAFEQAVTAELSAQELRAFKREKTAWKFFEATPPSYRKVILHWVTTAKKAETRASRLATLVRACAAGTRLQWGRT